MSRLRITIGRIRGYHQIWEILILQQLPSFVAKDLWGFHTRNHEIDMLPNKRPRKYLFSRN